MQADEDSGVGGDLLGPINSDRSVRLPSQPGRPPRYPAGLPGSRPRPHGTVLPLELAVRRVDRRAALLDDATRRLLDGLLLVVLDPVRPVGTDDVGRQGHLVRGGAELEVDLQAVVVERDGAEHLGVAVGQRDAVPGQVLAEREVGGQHHVAAAVRLEGSGRGDGADELLLLLAGLDGGGDLELVQLGGWLSQGSTLIV